MASKFLCLREETTFGTKLGSSPSLYFKLLSEGINTTREDFFPETVEFWTTAEKAEGFFRTSGPAEILMDPLMFPKLLVLFISDGGAASAGGNGSASGSGYQHIFRFGVNEVVSSTGVKPFTTIIGQAIEKDRQIEGCFIQSMTIEAVARNPVTVSLNIVGSGKESLRTAATPTYTGYTDTYSVEQPYYTFASAQTMTVGNTDRLTTAPTIEAFRVTLERGYDADHYVLGTRYLYGQTMSGMSSVSGSMDFSFTSEDEHERFLTAVAGAAIGDQASFAVVLKLQGGTIGNSGNYSVQFTMTETYFTASTTSLSSRDRIIQTCDFRSNYNATDVGACQITMVADTQAYTSLS